MIGYTRAHRDRFNHPLFATQKFCRGYAWDWLIAHAAFKPHRIEVKGRTVTLDRGQLSYSLRYIATAWNWEKDAVSRLLTRLKSETMIATDTATGQLVITICNYDTYQSDNGASATGNATPNATAPRQHRDSTATNKKEGYNNDKEGKVLLPAKAAPKKRATRLPDDWVIPYKFTEWAVDQDIAREDIKIEADKFRDYWIGVGGQRGTKLNWEATWRNWIRNSKQIKGGHNGQRNSNDATLESIARAARTR